MKKSHDFHDFIVFDILGRMNGITSRPMMSGWCVYYDGVPFGAIIGNNFYIKTKSPTIIAELQEYGSEKFSYAKKDGKIISMNYWLVPEDLFDNFEVIQSLVERVVEENLITKKIQLT